MRRTLPSIAAVTAGAVLASLAPASPARASSVQAAPALRFHSAQYDSPGTDTRTDASLNAEWISLVNTGATAVNLTGWRIVDRSRTYTFGTVTIAGKGGRLWLHTGRGTTGKGHLYWGSGNYVWNNTGDTATLLTKAGKTHHTCTWGQKPGRTLVGC